MSNIRLPDYLERFSLTDFPVRVYDELIPFPHRICDELSAISLRRGGTSATVGAEFGETMLRLRHKSPSLNVTGCYSTASDTPLLCLKTGNDLAQLKLKLPRQDTMLPEIGAGLRYDTGAGVQVNTHVAAAPKQPIEGRLALRLFEAPRRPIWGVVRANARSDARKLLCGVFSKDAWLAGEVQNDKAVAIGVGLYNLGCVVSKGYRTVWATGNWRRYGLKFVAQVAEGERRTACVKAEHQCAYAKNAVEVKAGSEDKPCVRCRSRFRFKDIECQIHAASHPWCVELRQKIQVKMVRFDLSEWYDRCGFSIRPQIVIDVTA